ncbi:GNAT family N-acetyltransferase [Rhodobacter sp. KR11]|uniref:GNAT family N-acetyltransferase n=1 Tax=Rhodobacter sp. KR11 TaxID=2974588 RepID=UPI0022230D94|nr:GNAT family N-acetyltransferase [Rhodobacter sp. KR11]MCW1917577.1 GNAT family N-acetyltransferase [Rhodobacter sp. KR11]
MILRDADEADLPVVARILGEWVAETPWMPKLHTAEEDLWFVTKLRHEARMRVAALGPRASDVMGFLVRQDGEVLALYVAAGARGRGIGRALMADAMAASPEGGLWTFQANAAARGFYAALGLSEVMMTDGENEEGLPDVRLEWSR